MNIFFTIVIKGMFFLVPAFLVQSSLIFSVLNLLDKFVRRCPHLNNGPPRKEYFLLEFSFFWNSGNSWGFFCNCLPKRVLNGTYRDYSWSWQKALMHSLFKMNLGIDKLVSDMERQFLAYKRAMGQVIYYVFFCSGVSTLFIAGYT